MSSLLSAAQKATVNEAFSRLHDTFARDIYIYTEQKEDAEDSDYNSLYGRDLDGSESPYNTTLVKTTGQARVYYPENPKQEGDQFRSQANIPFSQGTIRLKVDDATYESLLTAAKIEVDDVLYSVDGDAKVVGPFGTQYYSIFLRREN